VYIGEGYISRAGQELKKQRREGIECCCGTSKEGMQRED
jgi:hypothetical protein